MLLKTLLRYCIHTEALQPNCKIMVMAHRNANNIRDPHVPKVPEVLRKIHKIHVTLP